MTKATSSSVISARGGCHGCAVTWSGRNAMVVAAQHHQRTKHRTWAEQTVRAEFGGKPAAGKDQGKLI